MESLLAQVEAWFVNLIDKRIDDRGGLFTREAVEEIVGESQLFKQHADDLTTYMIEEVIDNCLADKILNNFDISDFDSEITDIASGIAQDTLSELDISEYTSDIESIVDDRISAAQYTVSVST